MFHKLTQACGTFLSLIPECDCEPDVLAISLERFGIGEAQIIKAAEKLPEYHALEYMGVRLLIAEYINEFCCIFSEDERQHCEVTVPSPIFLIMSFQNAASGKIRFSTDALIAQIVLRSFFLYDKPIDVISAQKRLCGLNCMRAELSSVFDYILQFGVLCDECVKCGELCPDKVKVLSVSYPKNCGRAYAEKCTASFVQQCCETMGFELDSLIRHSAIKSYAQLVKVENSLQELNKRNDKLPLKANSFALVQTVQLAVFDDWNGVLNALTVLSNELKAAPESLGNKRFYCFYTPFLQPQVDREFRKNGVDLMGSAVFIYNNKNISFSLEGMAADWLSGMNVRGDAVTESDNIAREIKESGSCAYLTGMYGFDRWMGPAAAIHKKCLNDLHGIPVYFLDVDFWNGSSNIMDHIETMCSMKERKSDSLSHKKS